MRVHIDFRLARAYPSEFPFRMVRRVLLASLALVGLVVPAVAVAAPVAPWTVEDTITPADAPNQNFAPWNVIPSPKGDVVYLGNTSAGNILKLDPKTNAIMGTIDLPGLTGSTRMAISPDGRYLYVQPAPSWQPSPSFTKVDTTTGTIVGTVDQSLVPTRPRWFGVDPTGTALYTIATSDSPNGLFKNDLATNTLTRVPYAVNTPNLSTGAFSPDGRYLYLSYQLANGPGPNTGVLRVDLSNPSSQDNWVVIPGSNNNIGGLAVSPDGRLLYAWDMDLADLYVLNASTGAVLRTINAGTGCGTAYCSWALSFSLGLSPTGKYAVGMYAGNAAPADGNYAWMINLTTDAVTPLNSAAGFHNGPNHMPEYVAFIPDTACSSKFLIQNDPNWSNQQAEPGSVDIARAIAGPCAPMNVTATAGVEKLDVSFTAPDDDGGSPITGYEYSLDGGTTWKSTGSTGTTFSITGLKAGTKYTVVVRGVNAAASGASSAEASGTPEGGVTPSPVVKKPSIRIVSARVVSGSRMVAVVRVNRAGRVSVAGVLGGVRGCTATARATKPGLLTVSCGLGASARARVAAGPVVLRTVARLSVSGGVARDAARSTVQPFRPTPVTG
jgi:DNA-binding beta-propeller fold protein YncE